jgi:hypothetical protein
MAGFDDLTDLAGPAGLAPVAGQVHDAGHADDAGQVHDAGHADDAGARRARLAAVADRVRPVVLAREHTLPLVAPLTPLFPEGALRRGITVVVDGGGATSLALALGVAPVQGGSWVALVDLPECNLVAASEAGLPLERVACIATGGQWATAVAATIGAFDLVVVGVGPRVRAADVRRLGARARERGTVIVAVHGPERRGMWPDVPDLTLTATGSRWAGLGTGHGHLRTRTFDVLAEGRRGFSRPRRAELVLPLGAVPDPGAAEVVRPSVAGRDEHPTPVVRRAG